jgi:hypothetical protein
MIEVLCSPARAAFPTLPRSPAQNPAPYLEIKVIAEENRHG